MLQDPLRERAIRIRGAPKAVILLSGSGFTGKVFGSVQVSTAVLGGFWQAFFCKHRVWPLPRLPDYFYPYL